MEHKTLELYLLSNNDCNNTQHTFVIKKCYIHV